MTQENPSDMLEISTNLQIIQAEINRLEKIYGRPPGSVQLLAVSKTKPIEDVDAAIKAGQRNFGENYLDDAIIKVEATKGTASVWHFIGHIQSNKTKTIAENFDWIHTLDREKVAQRLSNQRPPDMPALNCCIQLNIDNETAKSGVSEHQLETLMNNIKDLPGLNIRGLMVIPSVRESLAEQREVFAKVRAIFINMKEKHPKFDTLSMGMSADMEAAIAEGATIVRIGTAIFGRRNQ